MTNLNNKLLIAWAVLILDEKAAIDDVPNKLQSGVQSVMDYFTQAVSKSNQTQNADKTETQKPDIEATSDTSTDFVKDESNAIQTQSDENQIQLQQDTEGQQ